MINLIEEAMEAQAQWLEWVKQREAVTNPTPEQLIHGLHAFAHAKDVDVADAAIAERDLALWDSMTEGKGYQLTDYAMNALHDASERAKAVRATASLNAARAEEEAYRKHGAYVADLLNLSKLLESLSATEAPTRPTSRELATVVDVERLRTMPKPSIDLMLSQAKGNAEHAQARASELIHARDVVGKLAAASVKKAAFPVLNDAISVAQQQAEAEQSNVAAIMAEVQRRKDEAAKAEQAERMKNDIPSVVADLQRQIDELRGKTAQE